MSNHCRFGSKLEAAHDEERLVKFEDLLEAAIDLDRIPDEYLICASYDAHLEVQAQASGLHHRLMTDCSSFTKEGLCFLTLTSHCL